jgi:hypothetical protein
MNIFYVIEVKFLVLIKWLYTVTNKHEYVVHKLNFGSHLLADSNQKQSEQVIKARVQVINCINVKPKSGFLNRKC